MVAAGGERTRRRQGRFAMRHRRRPWRRGLMECKKTVSVRPRDVALAQSGVRDSGVDRPMTIPIIRRAVPSCVDALLGAGIPAVLARVYAARGITSTAELEYGLASLPTVASLANIDAAVDRLIHAIRARERIII